MNPKYEVIMANDAWDKMWTYTDLVQGEIACFGYAKLLSDERLVYIDDVFLVPQVASPAEVDFISEGLVYAIEKAIEDDRVDDLRFCVHSHGTHGVGWSSTDEDMIRKVGSTGAPWFVSAVFNKHGAHTARLDVFDIPPFGRMQCTWKDLVIMEDRSAEYEQNRLNEIAQLVRKPVPPKPKTKQLPPRTAAEATQIGESNRQKSFAGVKPTHSQGIFEDMGDDELEDLAEAMDWKWQDDNDGNRWYYDDTGIITVRGPQFQPVLTAHAYTPGV